MAAPEYIAKSAFASGTAALAAVGAVAGVVAGDLILLFVESENQAVPSTPTGGAGGTWVEVTGSPQGTGSAGAVGATRLTVYYQIATGADATTSVADTGDHNCAIKVCIRGADTTTPFDATSGGVQASAATTLNMPDVTTSVADCLIVYGIALDIDGASTARMDTLTNANLTSLTERHDQTVATADGGGIGVITGVKATAGAVGTTTVAVTSTIATYLTMAIKPLAERTGSMSVTETGTETATGSGDVLIDGALSVSETGTDSLTASGTVADPAITGSMSVSEVGVDTATGSGDVFVRGSLSASEAGQDTAVGSGDVYISGALTATEGGTDSFNGNGFGIVQTLGSMSVTESGIDTLSGAGDVYVQGVLGATEVIDTAIGSGSVNVRGSLTVSEVGADTFSGSGNLGLPTTTGVMSALEGADTLSGSGTVLVQGVMSVTDGQDSFTATNVVPAERPRVVSGFNQAQAEWESRQKWRKKAETLLDEPEQEVVPEVVQEAIEIDAILPRLYEPVESLAELVADARLLQLDEARALESAMAVKDVLAIAELAYLAEVAVQQEKDAIAAFIMFMD
jgi:hypothetical protein